MKRPLFLAWLTMARSRLLLPIVPSHKLPWFVIAIALAFLGHPGGATGITILTILEH